MSTRGQQVSEAVTLELLRPGCLRWMLTSSLSKLGVSEREARTTQYLPIFYNADKISGLDSLHMNIESLCIISDLGNQIGLANSYITSSKTKNSREKKPHTYSWQTVECLNLIGTIAKL